MLFMDATNIVRIVCKCYYCCPDLTIGCDIFVGVLLYAPQ
jgi:hypothetical protein